jgi:DNA-binding transcriptional LysR family regulator
MNCARDMVHIRLSAPGRIVVAAAPAYLKRRGVPQKPADLLQHDCICMRWSASGEPWAWELGRGKKTWRVPVRGPVITNNFELMPLMAVAGVGIVYAMEQRIVREISRRRLRVVLEPYAPEIPGLFLYFPSRAQVSAALRAFVEVAHEVAEEREFLPLGEAMLREHGTRR